MPVFNYFQPLIVSTALGQTSFCLAHKCIIKQR